MEYLAISLLTIFITLVAWATVWLRPPVTWTTWPTLWKEWTTIRTKKQKRTRKDTNPKTPRPRLTGNDQPQPDEPMHPSTYRTEQRWARRIMLLLLCAGGLIPAILACAVIWQREKNRIEQGKVTDFTWFLGQYAIVFLAICLINIGVLIYLL